MLPCPLPARAPTLAHPCELLCVAFPSGSRLRRGKFRDPSSLHAFNCKLIGMGAEKLRTAKEVVVKVEAHRSRKIKKKPPRKSAKKARVEEDEKKLKRAVYTIPGAHLQPGKWTTATCCPIVASHPEYMLKFLAPAARPIHE